MLDADALLAGPRGRGLCMSVASSLSWDIRKATFADNAREAVGELVRELAGLDPALIAEWSDPHSFVDPVAESVAAGMYWQEPHIEDVAASEPVVIDALRPTAEAVVAAPATRWWDTPLDLTALRYTSVVDDQAPVAVATLSGARERLREWRAETVQDERRAAAERPKDPTAPYSGCWWSTPAGHAIVTTTRPLSQLGSISLVWEEDDFGPELAAIWSLTPTRAPRVWEIDRPDAWVRLVEGYPLNVTHARRHDWYRTTGRVGDWAIPDWAAVAADWDAVHLSVAGYLTTATRSLDLADGATVLAGWNPDETWWLNDVLHLESPDPQWWALTSDGSPDADPVWQLTQP